MMTSLTHTWFACVGLGWLSKRFGAQRSPWVETVVRGVKDLITCFLRDTSMNSYLQHQYEELLSPTSIENFVNNRQILPIPMPHLQPADQQHVDTKHEEPFQDLLSDGDGRFTYVDNERSLGFFPYESVGQLLASNFNEQVAFSSSAAIIGKNTILTAAHCIWDSRKNNFFDQIIFIPAHPRGQVAYVVEKSFIPSQYSPQKLAWDFALCYIRSQTPFNVGASCGVVAERGNLVDNDKWWSLSYPAEAPFDGSRQIMEGGIFNINAFRDSSGLTFRADLVAMNHHDITRGCSGGPWFIIYNSSSNWDTERPQGTVLIEGGRFKNGRKHYINALYSFTRSDKPGNIYSPEFDERFKIFFNDVRATNPIEPIVPIHAIV